MCIEQLCDCLLIFSSLMRKKTGNHQEDYWEEKPDQCTAKQESNVKTPGFVEGDCHDIYREKGNILLIWNID